MVDMSETGRDPYADYVTINKELAEYGFALTKRPQIIVASKWMKMVLRQISKTKN